MFQTKLISGGKKKQRLEVIKQLVKENLGVDLFKGHPDLLIISGQKTIGIQEIRQMKRQLALKPYQAKIKMAIILEAEKLTLPAQNALLKTLEEPPSQSLIILTSFQKEVLLPTILSRCQIISLPAASQVEITKEEQKMALLILEKALNSSPGKRLQQVEKMVSGQEEVLAFTETLLSAWHTLLQEKVRVSKPSRKSLAHLSFEQIKLGLESSSQALRALQAYVNPKLVLGNLFLTYPFLGSK